ncbi:hypothetical protein [Agriterribacter sp.]|uniref:hypothetical protein n=1 Tax=Agriterribacter sp. TaxID=2821509 RepID=UPI002C247D7E|nr:hypothetical protein [Agriterribacter sp.]HRP55104.1 hypothetical protein [Agriterribacter sp.]
MLTKADIEQYFIAEKSAGLLFLILGIAAVLIAVVFFTFLKSPIYKGAAWPLIILGALQAGIGYTIYARSDKQRIDTVYAYDMNPGKLKSEEFPRMEKAIKSITIFLALEFVLLVVGIVLIWANRLFFVNVQPKGSAFWVGIGLVFIIQSLLLSGADYLAYKRGKEYIAKLEHFTGKP